MKIPPITRENSSFGKKLQPDKSILEAAKHYAACDKLKELDIIPTPIIKDNISDVLIIGGKIPEPPVALTFMPQNNSGLSVPLAIAQPKDLSSERLLKTLASKNPKLAELLDFHPDIKALTEETLSKIQ